MRLAVGLRPAPVGAHIAPRFLSWFEGVIPGEAGERGEGIKSMGQGRTLRIPLQEDRQIRLLQTVIGGGTGFLIREPFTPLPTSQLVFNVRQKTDARYSYAGRLSVRPSVSPSVCLYCVETAQPIVKLSSLPGSPMILVLRGPKFFPEFQWEHPQRGR